MRLVAKHCTSRLPRQIVPRTWPLYRFLRQCLTISNILNCEPEPTLHPVAPCTTNKANRLRTVLIMGQIWAQYKVESSQAPVLDLRSV